MEASGDLSGTKIWREPLIVITRSREEDLGFTGEVYFDNVENEIIHQKTFSENIILISKFNT